MQLFTSLRHENFPKASVLQLHCFDSSFLLGITVSKYLTMHFCTSYNNFQPNIYCCDFYLDFSIIVYCFVCLFFFYCFMYFFVSVTFIRTLHFQQHFGNNAIMNRFVNEHTITLYTITACHRKSRSEFYQLTSFFRTRKHVLEHHFICNPLLSYVLFCTLCN